VQNLHKNRNGTPYLFAARAGLLSLQIRELVILSEVKDLMVQAEKILLKAAQDDNSTKMAGVTQPFLCLTSIVKPTPQPS